MNVENQTVEQQENIGMTDGDDRNELQTSCMRAFTIDHSSDRDDEISVEFKGGSVEWKNGDCVDFDDRSGVFIGLTKDGELAVVEIDNQDMDYDIDLVLVRNLRKPETPEQKKERERLENGKALYELVQNIWCDVCDNYTPTSYSSPIVTESVKEMYARLAEEVSYRK